MANERSTRIAQLNDALRQNFRTDDSDGQVVCTPGIWNLPVDTREQLFSRVVSYADFNDGNDPYGERDMGFITLKPNDGGYMWKIDYYDKACEYGSPDPSDPAVTTRVMTILRADEY